MFRIKSVNEASENDFVGKDTIIVVSAITGKTVEKTPGQLARRDDNGFKEKTIPVGAELYYAVDADTAKKLMATDLFYSNVDPEEGQLISMLKGLEPVAVHTTGRKRGINFGYRESDDFYPYCSVIKSMIAAFGGGDARVYNFKFAHNAGLTTVTSLRGVKLVSVYGDWYDKTDSLDNPMNSGEPLNPKRRSGAAESERLQKLASRARPDSDFAAFFAALRPKVLAFTEDEASPLSMMEDFETDRRKADVTGGWRPVTAAVSKAYASVRAEKPALERGLAALIASDKQYAYAPHFNSDGSLCITVKYVMRDPLDSDFYEEHDPMLGYLAAHMPSGFQASFAEADEGGSSAKFIGSKKVLWKQSSSESGPSGAEQSVDYGVTETLAIRKVSVVDEGEQFNPNDAKTDDLFVKGDKYESRLSDARRVYDPHKHMTDEVPEPNMLKEITPNIVQLPDGRYFLRAYRKDGYMYNWAFDSLDACRDYEDYKYHGLKESDDDFTEVDFPAQALDYAVNAELGSVSRTEKFAVDKWFEMMGREGYDTGLISYGNDEFFSSDPEFGLLCDCVKAKLPKKVVGEREYPDYSGNAYKNKARMTYGGTQTPKSAVFAKGVDIKPLTVGELLTILQDGRQTAPVMFIQRKMNGERASSTTVNYAHPFRLGRTREGQKAIVMFDDISFPKRSFASVDRTPSTTGEISAELEKFSGTSLDKGVGIASHSNRTQAIRAVYAAYFKDGRFYMEMKQNTVSEDEPQDVVTKYLGTMD